MRNIFRQYRNLRIFFSKNKLCISTPILNFNFPLSKTCWWFIYKHYAWEQDYHQYTKLNCILYSELLFSCVCYIYVHSTGGCWLHNTSSKAEQFCVRAPIFQTSVTKCICGYFWNLKWTSSAREVEREWRLMARLALNIQL